MATVNLSNRSRQQARKPARISAAAEAQHGWTVSLDGSLRRTEQLLLITGASPCDVQDAWLGPIKGVRTRDGHALHVEFFVGKWLDNADLDPVRSQDFADLLGELRELSSDYGQLQSLADLRDDLTRFNGETKATGEQCELHPWSEWTPPPVDELLRRLADLGHEAAIDEHGDLRTSLKRRGCDLQVKAAVGRGRLRFSMHLGRFAKLSPPATAAMLSLVQQANDHTRLARLIWKLEDQALSVGAQVDLTGLPAELGRPACAALWDSTIAMTMASLELVLRRLGLELQILADPAQQQLAEQFSDLMRERDRVLPPARVSGDDNSAIAADEETSARGSQTAGAMQI